jgi:anti-sigma28 factor (negative regulator of flagellin synthesis)
MACDYFDFHSDNELSSRRLKPIKGKGFMMISGLSSANSVSYTPSTPRAQVQPAGDQVAMSLSADTFSSLVQEAGQMPDVRSDLVDSFKSRIQSGTYPSQETVDGLADRMGATWSQSAGVSSSDS